MENNFEKWYASTVDRDELLKLMRRSNSKGIIQVTLHFALLILLGVLAYNLIGTYWMFPAFFVYGTVYCFLNHVMHETHHRTPFKSNGLNEFVHWVTAFAHGAEPIFDRWGHSQHHTYTYFPDLDPEVPSARPIKIPILLGHYFGIGIIKPLPIIKHAMGILDDYTKKLVPEPDWNKMIWSSRLWILAYVSIIGASIYFQTFLPLVFTLFARFYGAFIPTMLNNTQHVGLEENSFDHRLSTRNVKINPLFSFLYWNMEYHIEHHMFPGVPFHSLSKLNSLIKDQLPAPYKSVWAVYKEMVPTVLRQQKEPDFHVTPKIPESNKKETYTESKSDSEQIVTIEGDLRWVSAVNTDYFSSNGVAPFKFEKKHYAIYSLNGEYYASSASCTHAGALLSKGIVIDHSIECPAHQGRFDIKSGKATHTPACHDLETYPVREKDGYILIGIPLLPQ